MRIFAVSCRLLLLLNQYAPVLLQHIHLILIGPWLCFFFFVFLFLFFFFSNPCSLFLHSPLRSPKRATAIVALRHDDELFAQSHRRGADGGHDHGGPHSLLSGTRVCVCVCIWIDLCIFIFRVCVFVCVYVYYCVCVAFFFTPCNTLNKTRTPQRHGFVQDPTTLLRHRAPKRAEGREKTIVLRATVNPIGDVTCVAMVPAVRVNVCSFLCNICFMRVEI